MAGIFPGLIYSRDHARVRLRRERATWRRAYLHHRCTAVPVELRGSVGSLSAVVALFSRERAPRQYGGPSQCGILAGGDSTSRCPPTWCVEKKGGAGKSRSSLSSHPPPNVTGRPPASCCLLLNRRLQPRAEMRRAARPRGLRLHCYCWAEDLCSFPGRRGASYGCDQAPLLLLY